MKTKLLLPLLLLGSHLVHSSSLAESPGEHSATDLAEQRDHLDETVWAPEIAAGEHEKPFIQLWDRLRESHQPLAELSNFPVKKLLLGEKVTAQSREQGVRELRLDAPYRTLTQAQFRTIVDNLREQGFRLEESEWHHSSFRQTAGQAVSEVDFVLHVRHQRGPDAGDDARIVVRGKLEVAWAKPATPAASTAQADSITVRNLVMLTRVGPAAFQHTFTYERRSQDVASAHPILLHDLDQNGWPEIIVSRWNRVYWNQGGGKFREQPMFAQPTPLAETGLVADFDDDGRADFLSVDKQGQLVFFAGQDGRFGSAQVVSSVRVPGALAMTAGDIDQDGDLDLWVSQYKPAYLEGQMPTPYYDANDGEPSYLLVNNGQCYFHDRTEAAGLAAKRNRRTYSASFVDYDGDRDRDLVVVSDYAGVDLYQNDGAGKFRDVTQRLADHRHLFGMSHTFSDFNGDGKLDLYAIGMSSTTARRLDAMQLTRIDRPEIAKMRAAMGFGNRVYTWQGTEFTQPSFYAQLARTGWSWGVTTMDYDLDGDEDIYVANGFRSGRSCQDYCSTFWRHDIYTGDSTSNVRVANVFTKSMQPLNSGGISWNGYEHNALFQNSDHRQYTNIAYLMGIGCEYDARAVVGNDLDGDGRPDLIVTEYQLADRGYIMKLHVYRNVLPTKNHWIGVRLPESGGHGGLFGTVVELSAGGRRQIRQIVSGDSFLAQHDNVAHFGTGEVDDVEKITVRWPSGREKELLHPAVDQYHVVRPGATAVGTE